MHERRGNWGAQLPPRLPDRPVRWFPTRSTADLDAALTGLACPVVLIDLSRNLEALRDLLRVSTYAPDARTLVLDPEAHAEIPALARELGATEVLSGFVPPPEVAERIDRWIRLAAAQAERAGWSKPLASESPGDPEHWIAAIQKDYGERLWS